MLLTPLLASYTEVRAAPAGGYGQAEGGGEEADDHNRHQVGPHGHGEHCHPWLVLLLDAYTQVRWNNDGDNINNNNLSTLQGFFIHNLWLHSCHMSSYRSDGV